MKKILAMILVILMISTSLVACTPESGPVESSPESSSEAESTPAPETKDPLEEAKDELALPDGVNFEGKIASIGYWEGSRIPFTVDEEDLAVGSVIDETVYKRNSYVEQYLGITLKFKAIRSESTSATQWCNMLMVEMNNAFTPLDLYAAYSKYAPTATIRGYSQDLSAYEVLDLTKAWWPQNVKSQLSIGDEIHYVSGDASPDLVLNAYGVFYDKNSVDEDIYSLVKSGDWTLEKFFEINTKSYEDSDGENGKTVGDVFSTAICWWDTDALILSSGETVIVPDSTAGKFFKINDDLMGDKVKNTVDSLVNFAKRDNVFVQNDNEITALPAFTDGRAVYFISSLYSVDEIKKSPDMNYGIAPIPACEKNGQYVTALGHTYSMYSISDKSKDPELAAAVLQTFGYFSGEVTAPVVYEFCIKNRTSGSTEDDEMFEFIKSGIRFDQSKLFSDYLSNAPELLPKAVKNLTSFTKEYNVVQRSLLTKKLDTVNQDLSAVIGK